MNDEPKEIEDVLNKLRNGWYSQIEHNGTSDYVARLNRIAQRINAFFSLLNDLVYKKHSHYKNEVRLALRFDEEWFPGESAAAISAFAEKVNALPENAEHKTIRVLDESYGKLLDFHWVSWSRWIPLVNDRIDAITENLRKSGVTGFEK